MYGMWWFLAYAWANFWSTSRRGRSILLPTTGGERQNTTSLPLSVQSRLIGKGVHRGLLEPPLGQKTSETNHQASPTLAWLHWARVCVSIYACLDWPLIVNFKRNQNFNILRCPRRCVLQLSHENECEGLLPDCRVSVKESEDDSSWMRWQHTRQFTFWTLVSRAKDDRVTRQAMSDRQ